MKRPLGCSTNFCSEGCFCQDGFVLNGDECTPPDECGCLLDGLYFKKNEIIVPSRNCDVRCKCHGYNNYTCEPIQCAENTATCTPGDRSYQCVCNPGYEGDGITCTIPCTGDDHYRCSDGSCIYASRRCDRTSDCPQGDDESEELCCDILQIDDYCPTPGYDACQNGVYIPEEQFCDGWSGDCPDNYDESEEICSSRCTFEPSMEELLIHPVRGTYKDGSNISFTCQMGYTLVGETHLVCYNQTWSGEEPVCYEDCKKPNPPNNGAWNDTVDDFKHGEALSAVCNPGYEPVPDSPVTCYDGKVDNKNVKCKDIDECSSDPCQNGSCINNKNGFRCICDKGYQGTLCDEDISECSSPTSNDCDADATCLEIPGGFTCECRSGFSGDGRSCTEDIFFPYGISEGDNRLVETADMMYRSINSYLDLASPTIKPRTGFPLGDEFYYSLYIVDNGLIIFTKENEGKFFYSYAYDRFTGSDDILCVAPFWSDAYIDKSFGEVYYQEYIKSKDGTPPATSAILDEISNRINNESSSLDGTFSAAWALVVTWENMRALGTATTNTYQAVITTDGIHSFALFNFQEGLMNWNYYALPYQKVIIGYSTGTDYRNEHLTMTLEEKFRPDSVTGNTGLKGRWIYRLENNSENVVNSKQLCLDWYDDEPDPTPWVDRFDPCPCSYNQAFRDRRLIWSYRAYSVDYYGVPLKWQGKVDSNFMDYLEEAKYNELCMQPTLPFPSWWLFDPTPKSWWWSWGSYKGNMCCYRWWDDSLIEGYYREVESSVAERYIFNLDYTQEPENYDAWFDNDLMPRHHCCARSNDESFCDLYLQKRPAVKDCGGYRPPRWSWMYRDPHFTTLDGYQYTFNGLGEYIMSRFVSPSDSTEEIFNLQGRTAKLLDGNGELTNATYFSAFAAQFVNSSKVEMVLSNDTNSIDVYLNNEAFDTTLLANGTAYKDGGLNGTFQLFKENITSSQITGYWSSGFSISVEVASGMLEVVLSAPENFRIGISAGLLGVWNGNKSDDLMRPDGNLQPKEDAMGNYTEREIFEFGETWRVPETGVSLFGYTDGKTWSDYNDVKFVPYFLDELIDQTVKEDPELYSNVTETCGSNKECTFDALASKNVEVGAGTKTSSETLELDSQRLENFPPNITGEDIIKCHVGDEVTYQVYAVDPDGDEVIYDLDEPVPDGATIYQNGLVTWTPMNVNDNVSLVIQATDTKGASSVLQPTIKLCACQNGTCNHETYLYDANIVEDKFAVVTCDCDPGYDGDFCDHNFDACQNTPCFVGVPCFDQLPPSDNFTCGVCPPGLVGNGIKCYDENECARSEEEGGSPCNHDCINIEGSFRCQCFEGGYVLEADQRTCSDINECESYTDECHEYATCTNMEGSYSCTCDSGFRGDGFSCEDISECEESLDNCDDNAVCVNTAGSFICECIDGFEGDGRNCTNINECERQETNCDEHATCTDTEGSYTCTCDLGWQGNGITCENVNECELGLNDCHQRATCVDTLGSYMCGCEEGFVQDTEAACKDIDECLQGSDDCDESADCLNTPGSFNCRCKDGYTGDGKICTDIDECSIPEMPCSLNAVCTNSEGGYVCVCEGGFEGDGISCVDVDECTTGNDDCDSSFSYCVNTEGSFECFCNRGYHGDGYNCTDIDECSRGTDDCAQTCTNNVGGFDCSCQSGYRSMVDEPNLCEDIDECSLGLSDCRQVCNNTTPEENPDGYICSCFEGFNLTDSGDCITAEPCTSLICVNGDCYSFEGTEECQCYQGYEKENTTACKDIDECTSTDYPHHCSYRQTGEPATCTNTEGGYLCSCRSGFQLDSADNKTCIDINECQESTDNCPTNSTYCFNLIGGFECKCLSGFDGISGECADINECNGTNECSPNAVCINSIGSYSCQCEKGFTGNGRVCTDINECNMNETICPKNSECSNTFGSYDCKCLDGYSDDGGGFCSDINECDKDPCSIWATCDNTEGSYLCTCLSGYEGDGSVCTDINECLLPSNDCSQHALCTNLNGTYSCLCNSGFTGNGSICNDINECHGNPCVEHSTCTNTDGSFRCECNDGFRRNALEACVDIDECFSNPDLCAADATCTNVIGSYLCECNQGFTGTGFECEDLDECSEGHDCSDMATCDNTQGSYICTCKDGYQTSPGAEKGRECDDVDECSLQIDSCDRESQDCINLDPFFKCNCKTGYQGNSEECTDIDECLEKPCKEFNNTRCVNSKGSYMCVCNTGYHNISGDCLETSYESLSGNMTVIRGLSVSTSWFESDNLETYRPGVIEDMDKLFLDADLTNYTGISVVDQVYMNDSVYYTFSMEFQPGSNVTNIPILETFKNSLIGPDKNRLPGPTEEMFNVVDPDSYTVGDKVTNPCIEQTDDCVPNSVCEFSDKDPFFNCTCQDGWSGDGFINCTDVDECQDDPDLCAENEVCINYPGSWACECDIEDGFQKIDDTCTELRVFEGYMDILEVNGQSVVFKESLNDPQSKDYIVLESTVCTLVTVTFQKTDVGEELVECDIKDFQPGNNILSTVYLSFGIDATVTSTELETQFEEMISQNDYVMDNSINNITLNENGTSFDSLSHIECEENSCSLNGNCTVLDKENITCQCEDGYSGDFCDEFITTPSLSTLMSTITPLTTSLTLSTWLTPSTTLLTPPTTSSTNSTTSLTTSTTLLTNSTTSLTTSLVTLTTKPPPDRLILIIVISIIAGFILLLLLILLGYWCARRKQTQKGMKDGRGSDTSSSVGSISSAQVAMATHTGAGGLSDFGRTNQGLSDDRDQTLTYSETSFDEEERLAQMEETLNRFGILKKEMAVLNASYPPRPSEYNSKGPYVADGSEALREKKQRKPLYSDAEEKPVVFPRPQFNFSKMTKR